MADDGAWDWLYRQFHATAGDARLDWLAQLSFTASMIARVTYGDDPDVRDPRRLRRFNELLHRIATFTLALRFNEAQRLPDDDFIDLVIRELSALAVDVHAFKSAMINAGKR